MSRAPCFDKRKFQLNNDELALALKSVEFCTFTLKSSSAMPLNAAKLDTLDVKDQKKSNLNGILPLANCHRVGLSLLHPGSATDTMCVGAPPHVGFNVSLHSAAQRDAAGSSDPSLAQSQAAAASRLSSL